MSRRRAVAEVPQKRDESWWLHPALRGKQPLPQADAGGWPQRWVRSDAEPARASTVEDGEGPYADFAKVLYRLNGCRPGPVRGFYVVVAVADKQFAVGQLCADSSCPVQLFEDLVFASEEDARKEAERLRKSSA